MHSMVMGSFFAEGPMFDVYELHEFEPSACSQLDRVGQQPHAREYLEGTSNGLRSMRQFECLSGEMIDHPGGIQFSGTP